MSIINGQQEVADFAERITPDLSPTIIMRHAPVAPFLATVLAMGTVLPAAQQKVEWPVGSLVPNTTAIDNGADNYDDTTTQLVVDDAYVFVAGDIVYAEATGERMYVVSVDNATTITVARGLGTSTAATGSVADNAVLRKVAYAGGEGTGIPEARTNSTSNLTTYAQHFKTPVDLSGIAMRSQTLSPDDELARLRRDAFEIHVRDINHAMLLGLAQVAQTDAGGKKVATMAGVIPGSTANATAIDGTMTLTEFQDAVEPVLVNSGGEAYAVCGATFLTAINDLFIGKLQVRQPDESFGLTVRSVLTAHGTVHLIPDYQTMKGALKGDAVVLPIGDLAIKSTNRNQGQHGSAPEAGQPGSGNNNLMLPHLRENLQNNDEDSRKDAWESELCLTGWDPESLTSITGVTGAG